MGYFASGAGSATLKNEKAQIELKKLLREKWDNKQWCDFDYDFGRDKINEETETRYWIDFSESDDHWHEEDTYEFLNLLVPYIVEGEACYTGDENCNWKYVFSPEEGKWLEEYGRVTYESDYKNFKFVDSDGDGKYKSKQIDEHLEAMDEDSCYIAQLQLVGSSAKKINLDKNVLEILKAYYSGKVVKIEKDVA